MTTLRYWAAARAAAGTAEEQVAATTLAGALDDARSRRDARFAAVLSSCSLVVDGDPVGARPHEGVFLADDSVVEVLPPFAGG